MYFLLPYENNENRDYIVVCDSIPYVGPLLLTWISNHTDYKVWDETTYPFQNFNGANVEVWE